MDRACCRRRMVAAKRCSEPAVPTEVPGSAKRPRGVASNANQEDDAGPSQELFEGLRRGELLRLLQQTLSDLGLDATRSTLERESGLAKEEEALSALRHEVLAKRWDEALQTVQAVDADVRAPVRRMLLEQKCLELHETGHGEAGLELLREDGAEAPHLEGLQAEEPMERLDALLPDLPPRRLPELLWQAVRYQHLHCLYADLDPGLMSTVPCLLKDYSYSPPPLPTHCVARLDHHRDEVWFASVSHDGRLLASSSKDESIVIWERADGAFFAVGGPDAMMRTRAAYGLSRLSRQLGKAAVPVEPAGKYRVAIVGGGSAGVSVASQLCRKLGLNEQIAVIEPRDWLSAMAETGLEAASALGSRLDIETCSPLARRTA
ncbi:unnamed protein product [Effrenium voratum]|nr:unnamed protein product [Effrenium voratum]